MTYSALDLNDLRKKDINFKSKSPFRCQQDAWKKMDRTFSFKGYNGALVVLPTGAGKTFTAVRWLCKNVLSKNGKVIWLAQSAFLLNQAYKVFYENALDLPKDKKFLNIRVVSSSKEHCTASTIDPTDDVVIITTQTAISNFKSKALDVNGNKYETKFINFLKKNKTSGIFIVLDEAHHAPAYGFRHLWMGIKDLIPDMNILGLTATPTHMDKNISGWLKKIFNQWIIYQADQNKLIAEGILAKPRYIEKNTGKEFPVDDKLYKRLVMERKDLPPDIVAELASDAPRNDYIIDEYINNKNKYGKTIIFAGTWPQCVYLSTKLKDANIKSDYVFSMIEGNYGSDDSKLLIERRSQSENEKVIEKFKEGKIAVVSNIRMLTEGFDVPDVKTVFLTRPTTSSILLTQMIGRALRGKKAGGGKEEANIVMFIDKWRGLVGAFADPEGINEVDPPTIRDPRIRDSVPIKVTEEISNLIHGESMHRDLSINEYIPVGWYKTEIIRSIQDDIIDDPNKPKEEPKEETGNFIDFVMAYNNSKGKLEKFINEKYNSIPEEWSDEKLEDQSIAPQIRVWMNDYFDIEQDIIGARFENDLIKICRHIAIHGSKPLYYPFTEREKYDITKIAKDNKRLPKEEQIHLLESLFEEPDNLWKVYYNSLQMFITAFDFELTRIILGGKVDGINSPPPPPPPPPELPPEIKRYIKQRDNYTCLCCGRNGKGAKLQIDHIIPKYQTGTDDIENLQTLCGSCNREKGINGINFRNSNTTRDALKELHLFPVRGDEPKLCTLQRTINIFYHCNAVSDIKTSLKKNGKFYTTWEVELNKSINPKLLMERKKELIGYIKKDLGFKNVMDIRIVSAD
jgi:superfamily II DNA or RNA helicase